MTSIFLIIFWVSSSCLLTFFSFPLIVFYLLHVFLGEILQLQRKHNFPDLLCSLFHLPETSSSHIIYHWVYVWANITFSTILPVHVFLSSFLLAPSNHHTFVEVIYQLLRLKQILHLALLRDILQSENKNL